MIKVFTKKTLEFKNRESGETVLTPVLDFCQLPDWVVYDPLFQWAKNDENLQEFEQESKASKKPKEKKEPEEKDAAQPIADNAGDDHAGL